MSKQLNCVNNEPEILHGNWFPTGSIMKYNFYGLNYGTQVANTSDTVALFHHPLLLLHLLTLF